MQDKPKFVQFGAGNIGRSFVGQLFALGGYEVVFVDVVEEVVRALNERRRYRIEVKDRVSRTIWVEGVRAVDGRDPEAAAQELMDCALCGTAVGANALAAVAPTVARGLELRLAAGAPPLDIILCENLRDAARFFRDALRQHLPADFPLDDMVGLVETSIGKMVPLMPEEVRRADPLLVYAEAYNTLICDRKGFKNPVPKVEGLDPKDNMQAYVDRKSFIHNFGHALLAYFAHLEAPQITKTWEAVEHPTVGAATRAGMWESARALIAEYPQEFNEHNQGEHIEDLLTRFSNQALGDTIYRVGRDVRRKLSRNDRVIGPLLLETRHGSPGEITALCAAAGMRFLAPDETGKPFPADEQFAREVFSRGPEYVLETVCELKENDPVDQRAREAVLEADRQLQARLRAGVSIFPQALRKGP